MNWLFVYPLPNLYVESLVAIVMVLREGDFGR